MLKWASSFFSYSVRANSCAISPIPIQYVATQVIADYAAENKDRPWRGSNSTVSIALPTPLWHNKLSYSIKIRPFLGFLLLWVYLSRKAYLEKNLPFVVLVIIEMAFDGAQVSVIL